jgi:hypothetical protein
MAALQALPLATIEMSEDEWSAPARQSQRTMSGLPDVLIEEPDEEIGLTAEVRPVAAGARSEREWAALIESLRSDVDRLRAERTDKPARKVPPARAVSKDKKVKPIQDEWGFFDPEQCGFAALLAKLDEVTESEDRHVNH